MALTRSSDCEVVHENVDYNFKIHLLKIAPASPMILFTEGMAEYEQAVNADNEDLKHIELYFYLPGYWNLATDEWPLHWLNRIAQVPQKNETWFGHGDTIPAGNPPEELQTTFKADHFIIARPKALEYSLKSKWTHNTKLLAVIPLFKKEVDYKLRNSFSVLFKKMEKNNIDEKVDPYRTSCCRKRILGMI